MSGRDIRLFPAHTFHPDRVLNKIHKAIHHPGYFSDSGVGRFDLETQTGKGTCYLSLSPVGAFVEALGRFRFLTQEKIDKRSLSFVSLTRPLRLADLTNRNVLGGFGIAGDLSAGADYGPSHKWAADLHEVGFDGLFYAARHDPAFTERSVAVFGNERSGKKLFAVTTSPIPPELVAEARRKFGFTVWPRAPLM